MATDEGKGKGNGRKGPLDRTLQLVRALADTSEGLTLDEMAEVLGQARRSAERTRNLIALHFDLDESRDGRAKRFRIRDSLRRHYVRPSAEELAALQAEVEACHVAGSPRAALLGTLLAKVRGSLDDREKMRIDPDMAELVRLQRSVVGPGPRADVPEETMRAVTGAIMAGNCLEFDYRAEGASEPQWRLVVPYGLVHGAISYVVGQMPLRDLPPVLYRLDRMSGARIANRPGAAPPDFDLDAWLAESFGLWRDARHDVHLRILPHAASRARQWRFHRDETVEEEADGGLSVRFRAGGLRELAEHLFGWAGDAEIVAPEELRAMLRERLALCAAMAASYP